MLFMLPFDSCFPLTRAFIERSNLPRPAFLSCNSSGVGIVEGWKIIPFRWNLKTPPRSCRFYVVFEAVEVSQDRRAWNWRADPHLGQILDGSRHLLRAQAVEDPPRQFLKVLHGLRSTRD